MKNWSTDTSWYAKFHDIDTVPFSLMIAEVIEGEKAGSVQVCAQHIIIMQSNLIYYCNVVLHMMLSCICTLCSQYFVFHEDRYSLDCILIKKTICP